MCRRRHNVDNGPEFINAHLLRWCEYNKLTFTRSRAGRKNDGAHVEQKNWSVVRRAVGYHRYDIAATPYQRILADEHLTKKAKKQLTRQYNSLNPAQIRRDLLDLQDQLLKFVKTKHQPTKLPVKPPAATRAKGGFWRTSQHPRRRSCDGSSRTAA